MSIKKKKVRKGEESKQGESQLHGRSTLPHAPGTSLPEDMWKTPVPGLQSCYSTPTMTQHNPPGPAGVASLYFLQVKTSRNYSWGHTQVGCWVRWDPGSFVHFSHLIFPII